MTFDLILGFRQRPAHLGEALDALGFTLERVVPKEDILGVTMEYYEFFEEGKSGRGVHFTYHDGTYPDHQVSWASIVDNPNTIVATGSLTTTRGRLAVDERKQLSAGRFLRDYYDAILHDPQAGKRILD